MKTKIKNNKINLKIMKMKIKKIMKTKIKIKKIMKIKMIIKKIKKYKI